MYQIAASPFRLLAITLFTSSALAQVLIPIPKGSYHVAYSTAKLIDEARIDPYDPDQGKRNVMISLFYPVEKSECRKTCPISYLPPVTALYADAYAAENGIPNGTFGSVQLQVCCEPTPKAAKALDRFPVVLYSPGLGGSRLLSGAMVQRLASTGYIVATMDHTFESIIVEYPDGTFTPGLNGTFWDPSIPGRLEDLLQVRVADGKFVLSQLGLTSVVQKMVPGATCGLNTKRAGFFGHSFGGATAINMLMNDKRIVGSVNMDGNQWGPITDTKKPLILFGRAAPSPHSSEDTPSWRDILDHAKGWKRELALRDSRHQTFWDIPLILKLSGVPISDTLREVIGELDGQRSFDTIITYVGAFMDFALRGKKSKLFDGPSEAYPEVEILSK